MSVGTVLNSGRSTAELTQDSAQYSDGKFRNPVDAMKMSGAGLWNMFKDYRQNKSKQATPTDALPVQAIDPASLLNLPKAESRFYRLGHSTVLVWLNGEFWLTDPVFSERASPFQFVGPKRFHQPPISIEGLPPIKAVVLSHNHYDHLDKASIKALITKVEFFVCPLGVGADLIKWGVDPAKIIELDWWQDTSVAGVTLTATPSQHFSGRGLSDRDSTLWASWVFSAPEQPEQSAQTLFFSGDTGYFDGFKEIGKRFGPFDVTFMETGAYNKNWAGVHMLPEESVQAHLDLGGKQMVPIHNGTFDLSLHSWFDPFERVTAAALAGNVQVNTPVIGEAIVIGQMSGNPLWWQAVR
ncbi:MBL fold metallo-hydrolase [Reinekea sp.]|uniref:MBL fold metallo-hydrolase n=1 Tax=Reinekea sp. TaxID=1970455 RepID=UPI002A8261B8|nr:MBL fold metallo-hydrolase [Reinekea sp.]